MAPSDSKGGAEKPPPTDWGDVYSKFLFHSSMDYEQIARRTLPQINILLNRWGENISIKVGIPNIFGVSDGIPEGSTSNTDVSSQEEVDSFFNDF